MDSLLSPLYKAGLHVEVRPPSRLIVSGDLTDELRRYIRTHKAEILLALEDSNCQRCIHLRRPGAAYGYCSIRDDLPPAYGDTHPLRICPADGGASCAVVCFIRPH
ncbi:TubC N-terminal docking domain-containing protein [Bordetella tumbae]|nr:hypothetical protein CAL21_20550 [Bordetella genomosp. 4]